MGGQAARAHRTEPVGGLVAMMLASIALATGPIGGKWAYRTGMDPPTLLALRMGLAALLMWAFYAVAWRSAIRISSHGLLACGAVAIANSLAMLFYFLGLQRIDAGLTALIFYSYPVVVLLLLVQAGQPLTRRRLLRLMLALAGLYALTGTNSASVDLAGVALVLAAALAYAVYMVLSEWVLRSVRPRTVALYVVSGMAIILLIVRLSQGLEPNHVTPSGWEAVIFLALVTTVLARLLLFAGVDRIGSGPASLIGVTEPLAVVLMATFFLGEHLAPVQGIGGALILASLLLARRRSKTVSVQ